MESPLSECLGRMVPTRRGGWLGPVLLGLAVAAAICPEAALGQPLQFLGNRPLLTPRVSHFELSEAISLEEADGTVQTYLDRVAHFLADEQFDEAVETLRRVMEESPEKLIAVTERRYIPVRDYCHLQLAALPPEALSLYRGQVDPVARRWYEKGIAERDRGLLSDVVGQSLASSYGDDALTALGDMALEQGDYASARIAWERVIPVDRPPEVPNTWLAVPDTDLDLAAIRARLVLVSIMEGSFARARDELTQFRRLHGDAGGPFSGREVVYAEALAALLDEGAGWPETKTTPQWPTFAGSPQRHRTAPAPIDPGQVAWRLPLRDALPANLSIWGSGSPTPRMAEDAKLPLSYHPVLYGDMVLVNNQVEILAVDVHSGESAWGQTTAAIFRDAFDDPVHALYHPSNNLGVPRFTMTVAGDKLYARMGPSVTSRPAGGSMGGGHGYLVSIDLAGEGRLLWKVGPGEADWAFEGSPLVRGADVYVGMRRSDIRPQAHVGCLDAETGRLKWRRFVAAAETPARGQLHETTHHLLAMDRQTLYYNTNLGAVAAVSAVDGTLRWVSLYPRALQGDLLEPAGHRSRDLNPCLVDRGRLFVAPSDSPRIIAFDAATGQILWQTSTVVENAVHLLGVCGDQLIAAGDRLYWISLEPRTAGRVARVWPEGNEKLGHGRGLLVDGSVWWPTREKIFVLDAREGTPQKTIDLTTRGARGGNLLMAPGRLLIATSRELIALGEEGRRPLEPEPALATTISPLPQAGERPGVRGVETPR